MLITSGWNAMCVRHEAQHNELLPMFALSIHTLTLVKNVCNMNAALDCWAEPGTYHINTEQYKQLITTRMFHDACQSSKILEVSCTSKFRTASTCRVAACVRQTWTRGIGCEGGGPWPSAWHCQQEHPKELVKQNCNQQGTPVRCSAWLPQGQARQLYVALKWPASKPSSRMSSAKNSRYQRWIIGCINLFFVTCPGICFWGFHASLEPCIQD